VIWFLDTNTIIYAQHVRGAARERLDDASRRSRIVTSILVIAELLYGAERSSRPDANRKKVQLIGEELEILPIALSTAARFGVLKQQLGSRGRTKADVDLHIAAPRLTLVRHWSPMTAPFLEATSRGWWLRTGFERGSDGCKLVMLSEEQASGRPTGEGMAMTRDSAPRSPVALHNGLHALPGWLTILPFSGRRERERSDRRDGPTATRLDGSRAFVGEWRTDMLPGFLVTRAEAKIVPSSLIKTQGTIRTTSDPRGILVILPVVLPKADGTDLVSAALIESEMSAAWTGEPNAGLGSSDHRVRPELPDVVFKPPLSTRQFFG
jgi:tRNA(fMet)-specific endonuclease VapC